MTVSAPLLVSAADVVRVFGEGEAAVRALDGVTVGFPQSKFTAIMGPSGSGKSTLMHILAGLDRPTSGSVVLDGVEITSARRPRAHRAAARARRLRLPVLQPAAGPRRAARTSCCRCRSPASAPTAEWLDTLIDTVGLRDRLDPPPVRAVRRPAAARRRGARAGLAARRRLRRRADRQPRLEVLGRAARPAAPLGRRVRPDGRSWSPTTRPPPPTPTACSSSPTGASSTTSEARHSAEDVLDLMKAVS